MPIKESPSSWFVPVAVVFSLKFLLIPCYFSTDFDVHRNWLAVTNTLPISRWYIEDTSQWTLDYPPLFAWFEYFLSQLAKFADADMLSVQKEPFFSNSTLVFHRITVILGDIWLLLASIRISKSLQRMSKVPARRSGTLFGVTLVLLVCNVGLLLVDSIHFQYNGFLTGFLLLSIVSVLEEKYLCGAFWYFVLVNFKHIYLYLAPAYFCFFVRNYCLTEPGRTLDFRILLRSLSFRRVGLLFMILFVVFGASFGPFLCYGQLPQVLSRLFPFKRGLTHAYWAPNFWSLYNFADWALLHFLRKLKVISESAGTAPGYTSGLVQEFTHAVLPTITPLCTFVLTILSMLPFCALVILSPKRSEAFVRLLTFSAFCSYMFGWHVHEKAILLITIPLALLAVKDYRYGKIFLVLSTVGHFSLFPLFFTRFECPMKYLLVVFYTGFAVSGLCSVYKIGSAKSWNIPFLNFLETAYLFGLIPLEIYCNCLHYSFSLDKKGPFLPLMATSIYCAFGILYCWIWFSWLFLCEDLSLDVLWYKKVWAVEQNNLKKRLVTENVVRWQNAILENTEMLKLADGEKLRFVGGLDVSTPDGDALNACACLTVLTYPELEVIHSACAPVIIDKPYIAGFLAFREVWPMVDLVRTVKKKKPEVAPQVLLIDGNGILHPRGFGLASHVGVLLNMPAVGVAKNLHLVSGLVRDVRRYEEELVSPGQTIPLKDKDGKMLGCALRPTEQAKNPVFVSVGHNISLESAVALVINCSNYRVPEPIRQADQLSRKMIQLWV